MASESYRDLIFKLGDIAYERLWNKPDAPRVMERVLKAAETYERRQVELHEVEAAMDAEESAYRQFCEACDAELAECRAVVAQHPRAAQAAEAKAEAMEAKLVSQRKDLVVSKQGLQKLEAQIALYEESRDEGKARVARENLKRARLEVMRRTRECEELEGQIDRVLQPEDGPGADAIRARYRERDLEAQLEERTQTYRQLLGDLDEQAARKSEEIAAAKEYYEQALCLLGEEVFRARLADPALAAYYPKLDKARR